MRVWPSAEALEERLAAELADGEARVLCDDDLTWDDLVDRVIAAAPAQAASEPIGDRLALRAACVRASDLGAVASSPGFLAGVARFVAEAERAGLAPVDVDQPRARRLMAILVEKRRLGRGASRDRRRADAVRALRGGAPLRLPPIVVEPRLLWELADVELILAVARHTPVTVKLPWAADRPQVFAGIEPLLGAFEATGEAASLRLELQLEDPTDAGCARAIAGAVHRPGAAAPPPRWSGRRAAVSLLAAPDRRGEARSVAAHVRELVDGGAAPESIAVAMREPSGGGPLVDELERAGLAVDDRRRAALAQTPPARLALALLALPERGFAREEVLALLSSGQFSLTIRAADVARAARALGVRELAPGGVGLERLAATRGGAPLADGLAAFLAPIAALPGEAVLADHCQALAAALQLLLRRRNPPLPVDDGALTARRIVRGAARDGAAAVRVEGLLRRLPQAAAEARLAPSLLSRAEFAELLADALGEIPLASGGRTRGGAVRLVGLADLAARRFAHVILPGLVEGEAPARAVDDGVYGDRERHALNQAVGRRLLSVSRPPGDEGAPGERTPFEALLLVHALAAADESVLLSYPRTADDRPLARSPFVDEVLRVAPWLTVAEAPLGPLPLLGYARAPGDVLARVALEALAAPEDRLPPRAPIPGASTLLDGLSRKMPARAARVAALAAVERERWAFFQGRAPAGAFTGEVGVVDGLAARAGGGRETPIPVRQLEILASCGFAFYAGRVLGAAELEEAEDAPSALALGRLAHRCLETYYRRGLPRSREGLEEACATVFAQAEAQGIQGHPLLWRLGRKKLVDELWQVVAKDAPWGGTPELFELPFAFELDGVHVAGRIDRVDAVEGGHVVVDYKLGGRKPLVEKLKAAGEVDLQLPIYAAAIRATRPGQIDAAYISIREGAATRTLNATLGAEQARALLDEKLPARIGELGARARSGAFHVAPVDPDRCQWCAFRAACRVVHDVVDPEEEAAA